MRCAMAARTSIEPDDAVALGVNEVRTPGGAQADPGTAADSPTQVGCGPYRYCQRSETVHGFLYGGS